MLYITGFSLYSAISIHYCISLRDRWFHTKGLAAVVLMLKLVLTALPESSITEVGASKAKTDYKVCMSTFNVALLQRLREYERLHYHG